MIKCALKMHDQHKNQATLGQLFTVNNGLYSYSESTPIPYLFVIEAFFEIGQIKTPKKLDFSLYSIVWRYFVAHTWTYIKAKV